MGMKLGFSTHTDVQASARHVWPTIKADDDDDVHVDGVTICP
jgi:hypothetical protein